jgi:hypothetical protein
VIKKMRRYSYLSQEQWSCLFRSLTNMRRKMNSEINARVVLGGKLHGFR